MNRDEYDELNLMINSGGWKVYSALVKGRFSRELLGLRKKKKDSTFDRSNGLMDGLDAALAIPEEEMSEFSHNLPKEGGEKEEK